MSAVLYGTVCEEVFTVIEMSVQKNPWEIPHEEVLYAHFVLCARRRTFLAGESPESAR